MKPETCPGNTNGHVRRCYLAIYIRRTRRYARPLGRPYENFVDGSLSTSLSLTILPVFLLPSRPLPFPSRPLPIMIPPPRDRDLHHNITENNRTPFPSPSATLSKTIRPYLGVLCRSCTSWSMAPKAAAARTRTVDLKNIDFSKSSPTDGQANATTLGKRGVGVSRDYVVGYDTARYGTVRSSPVGSGPV